MPYYELRMQSRTGTYLGTVPFWDLQGEFRMNEPDQIRYKLSSQDLSKYIDPSLVKAGVTECALYRDNVNVFTGPIWTIGVSSAEKEMSVMAQDVSSYLMQRCIVIDVKYSSKNYAWIAWDLISRAQALTDGGLGITLGASVPTNWPKGSIKYARKTRTNLYKAITALSSGTTGFDWEITPARVMNMTYPRIQPAARVILEYGGAIKNYSVNAMGKYAYNDVMIRGGGSVVSTIQVDATSRALYGLRQYVETQSSLKSKTKLNSVARETLNLRKNPQLIPQLTVDSLKVNPFDGDIAYGSLVNTIIDDGWVQFNGTMRCSGWQLSLGNQGNETIVLYVNDTREIQDAGLE